MKNHKINYKKYISLATVLAMTLIGVAISPDLVNNTKYEVTDTNKATEEQVVTLPVEQVEEVKKVEVTPSEPAPNVKAQATVAVEKENPFKNKEFLDFFEDLNPETIIETGESTTANGKEVYYAWSTYFTGVNNVDTAAELYVIPKQSFDSMTDFFKDLEFGSQFKSTNTGLAADDKITVKYPEEKINNFELPTDILDNYYLPAKNSTGSIVINKDHSVTVSQITYSGLTVNLPSTASSFFSFFEKQADGEWHEINANSHATTSLDTKQYKEDFDLEKDLDFKAIIYLNTNTLIDDTSDEIIPTKLADLNNLKGTVIDVTKDIEITDVNNKQSQFSFGETVTLSVKNALGHKFEDLGQTYLDGNVKYAGLAGFGNLIVEVGYLGPKPDAPELETGVSTPELAAEPLKLPLENRDFKGLEELVYEAHDSKDGNLNSKVKIKSGAVNLSKVGKYTLVLEVTNSDGVTAEEQVVIEVFENVIEPKPETPVVPEDTETEIEDPKGPEPTDTPGVPETPEPETPETPAVEKPTETTPDVVAEPEQTKDVEKVEVTNDPKVEPVKEAETIKEQAEKETLEAKKEVTATPDVDKKAGPDKLLQTDIKPLNPALNLVGGIALVTAGLYFFKKSYLVFKKSLSNLKKF